MTWVRAIRRLRTDDKLRAIGDVFELPEFDAQHLEERGYVKAVRKPGHKLDWYSLDGRELRAPVIQTGKKAGRVVACVSIWNDFPALQQTMPTWLDHVDAVIILDGTYDGVKTPSTDGLVEWVKQQEKNKVLYICEAWASQAKKRTRFFEMTTKGDVLFIVDADESVTGAEALKDLPFGQVGMVTITSNLYTRPYGQPRIFRYQPDMRYEGRHSWVYRGDNKLVSTHQYAGTGISHFVTPIRLHNERRLGQTPERVEVKAQIQRAQYEKEKDTVGLSVASDRDIGGRESLRILQLTTYDPGLVAFRLHTAINATTPHNSALVRRMNDNPFSGPTQLAIGEEPTKEMRALLETADIVHSHLEYAILAEWEERGWLRPQVQVIHHHGTVLRTATKWFEVVDPRRSALRLISNWELTKYASEARWLPNPVPVAHYQAVRAMAKHKRGKVLRVCHSPSKRELKGTADFLLACEAAGVEPVLIEKKSHEESIRIKATCDVAFDSFWLGIQCSGVEAGAMGLPVIAGDEYVWTQYKAAGISHPYTYAPTREALTECLVRLSSDKQYFEEEADAAFQYVLEYHDEAAVALRYLDYLDEAVHWRQQMKLGRFNPDVSLRWPIPRDIEDLLPPAVIR